MKWSLMIVCSVLFSAVALGDESEVPKVIELKPLPDQLKSQYFSEKPERFLHDPQRLLKSREFRDRNDFLNYHSSDSEIDMWFYLFREDQEAPLEAADQLELLFADGKPSAIVFYYMGRPERSEMILSPSLAEVVSLSERARAIESSVEQALEDALVAKQLENFMLHLSIRIYWMEQLLGSKQEGASSEDISVEYDEPSVVAENSEKQKVHQLWSEYQRYVWYGVSGVGLLLVLLILRSVMVARAVYRFPELEVEPRLGGDHAAGVGAVISFASASVSPAAQRDQAPEYLRRL